MGVPLRAGGARFEYTKKRWAGKDGTEKKSGLSGTKGRLTGQNRAVCAALRNAVPYGDSSRMR